MNYVSWSVFGTLFILAEFAIGNFYLLVIGLAFVYPAIADYAGASADMQMAVLGSGVLAHVLLLMLFRKPVVSSSDLSDDVGQRVEVIEWTDECTARVVYQGKEWQADKVKSEMPDAAYGVIHSTHGSRLIISTE